MDDRNAIFNDCFSLGNSHAFLDSFTLSSLEGGLVLRHERLVAALVDKAASDGQILVVDRVHSLSPAAELLIEAALARTAARPTILVVDSLDRLKSFTGESGDVIAPATAASASGAM